MFVIFDLNVLIYAEDFYQPLVSNFNALFNLKLYRICLILDDIHSLKMSIISQIYDQFGLRSPSLVLGDAMVCSGCKNYRGSLVKIGVSIYRFDLSI